MSFSLAPDLHVETIDATHLVLVPGRDEVHQLTGPDAEAFALARAGTDTVPERLGPAMAGLVELGVVTSDSWSRRTVLRLGGAAAAAGVATIALPGIAAAASSPATSPTDSTAAPTTTVAPAPRGTLYIAERSKRRVFRVTPSGEQSTVATDLGWPQAVALDAAGNVYVAVASPAQVLRITPSGQQSTVATGLGNPAGLTLDAAGNVYISDSYTGQVLKVTPGGDQVTLASGLDGGEGVAVDSVGNVYVSETNRCRVVEIAPDGRQTSIDFAWAIEFPYGIAVDSAGTLYVILGTGDVIAVAPDGARATIGTDFWEPWGITVDAADTLYIADAYNGRVVRFTSTGDQVVVFSEAGVYPNGVAVA